MNLRGDDVRKFALQTEDIAQITGKTLWPLVLAKELIDNGLDACESTDVAPEIVVTLEPDAFTVSDNGPGLTPEIIDHSLDYHVRIGVIGKEHIELRAFRQQLLRQYHVESLNELPPGPCQDLRRLAARPGISREFVDRHFGSTKVRWPDKF